MAKDSDRQLTWEQEIAITARSILEEGDRCDHKELVKRHYRGRPQSKRIKDAVRDSLGAIRTELRKLGFPVTPVSDWFYEWGCDKALPAEWMYKTDEDGNREIDEDVVEKCLPARRRPTAGLVISSQYERLAVRHAARCAKRTKGSLDNRDAERTLLIDHGVVGAEDLPLFNFDRAEHLRIFLEARPARITQKKPAAPVTPEATEMPEDGSATPLAAKAPEDGE